MGGDPSWIMLLLPIPVGLAVFAVVLIRRLTKADVGHIKRRIEAKGATVVWVKRLDTEMGSRGDGFVTYYDALVERDGMRRIELWRDSQAGLARER
jgi:hypothetical protein